MGLAPMRPAAATEARSPRDTVVHEAFLAVADEFLDIVGPDKSGSVTVHFQNGVPLTHSWEIKGRTIVRRMRPDDDAA